MRPRCTSIRRWDSRSSTILAEKKIPAVWLNPGADSPEVIRRAEALGVRPIVACSILGVGEDPMDL